MTAVVAAAVVALAAAATLAACNDDSSTTPTSSTTSQAAPDHDGRPRRPIAVGRAELFPPEAAAASLKTLSERLGGSLGIAAAPLGRGPVIVLGHEPSKVAWSTMKVPVLVTLLRETGGVSGLSATQRSEAEAALERSDNDAALALFGDLEDAHGGLVPASRRIQDVLRRAGDPDTVVNTKPDPRGFSTFGQTDWSAVAATTFFRSLARGCLLPPSDTAYVLSLMRHVVADQRWGIGEAGYPPSTPLAFKGGWGPELDGTYLVRQSGLVGEGSGAYVASIIALPSAGGDTFAAGREMVTRAAAWLRNQVPEDFHAPPTDCG